MEPLILAIEPDRRQCAKLGLLARNLHFEMVIVTSVTEALDLLATRVPDLLLTSPQIVHREDAQLSDRLRELEAERLKTPRLTIPLLELPNRRPQGQQKGAVIRFHSRAQEAVDPTAFGMYLTRQLDRIVAERPITERRPSSAGPRADTDAAAFHVVAREIQSSEEGSSVASPLPPSTPRPAGWHDMLSSLQRDLDRMRIENREPNTAAPAAKGSESRRAAATPRPLAAVTIKKEPAAPSPTPESKPTNPRPVNTATSDPARKRKPKPQPPAQDEWGIFDPEQCGLAALRNKLNEISGNPKKPV